MLHLERLQLKFGNHTVLDGAEATLSPGICLLRGRNGSGKTSLLKILAGLLAYKGSVAFAGIDLRAQPTAYRSLLGWSEAEPLFPEHVTGHALLQLVADARGAKKCDNELAERLQFTHALGQRTASYSSGMQKKLALLLAFCGNPRLLLLDEPLSTLDAEAATALQGYITDYMRSGDRLCLLSTHLEPELLRHPNLQHYAIEGGKLIPQ